MKALPSAVLGFAAGFFAFAFLPSLLAGCASAPRHTQSVPDDAYRAALARTARPANPGVPAGSDLERAAIAGVTNLFVNYTAEGLAKNIPAVYAADTYFRDAFKQFDHADQIKAYMLHGLDPIRSCTFEFEKVLSDAGDYFFFWTMVVSFTSEDEGVVHRSMGASRMRFNEQGKVVFHQDYWDPTDLVWSRVPVAAPLLRWVKNRL